VLPLKEETVQTCCKREQRKLQAQSNIVEQNTNNFILASSLSLVNSITFSLDWGLTQNLIFIYVLITPCLNSIRNNMEEA